MRLRHFGYLGSLLTTLLSSFGCSPDNPVDLRGNRLLRSALAEAPTVLAQAEAGTLGRGEQDRLVRFERQLPGFGGLYVANGAVRVYMKADTIPLSRVRAVLAGVYSNHPMPAVREAMANVGTATVVKARYSLSEIIAIQRRIASSIHGWTGAGTIIMDNKVVVGFPDSASLESGLQEMESTGIPLDALTPIILGVARPATNFTDYVRPVRDGLMIALGNDTYDPHFYSWSDKCACYVPQYTGSYCTLGFNVHNSFGGDYFLTAAHCENIWRGQNGISGDTVFQPTVASPDRSNLVVGQITLNLGWHENSECPPNGLGGYWDFCTAADVALGRYTTTTGSRTIATSQYGGINGYPGSNQINSFYPITRVLPPEYVDSVMRHQVAKDGFMTYTTSGPFVSDMMDIKEPNICWRSTYLTGCPEHKSLYLWNQTLVQADVAGGDSGGSVFTGDPNNGAPYAALGIVQGESGRDPNLLPGQRCSTCRFNFSRWDSIEAWFNMGELNPKTNQ